MRVAHLVYSLSPGGMENGVVNLCNKLHQHNIQALICVLQEGGSLEQRIATNQVELFHVRRHFGNDPSVPIRLAMALRKRSIDILHTHCWVTLVEGFLAAKLSRTPGLIHGEHGTLETRPRNVAVQRMIWRRTTAITAVCHDLADRMSELTGHSRDAIDVICNGVNTEKFCPAKEAGARIRSELGVDPNVVLIGTVARLSKVKNHEGVLDALSRLRQSGYNCDLVLAGDGQLRDELTAQAKNLNIHEHVHFLGHYENVPDLINALDIVVLNSLSEGMSNTVLEAMACGAPIVATRVGENPRVIAHEESGLLVPASNTDALTHALQRLVESPELRASFGAMGRERVLAHFAIDQMVAEYAKLYDRVSRQPN